MGVKRLPKIDVEVLPVNPTHLMLIIAGLGVAYFMYREAKKGVAMVADKAGEVITEDLNPASQNNFINRGFTWIYQKIPGTGASLGSDVYDWTHPNENFTTTNPEELDN